MIFNRQLLDLSSSSLWAHTICRETFQVTGDGMRLLQTRSADFHDIEGVKNWKWMNGYFAKVFSMGMGGFGGRYLGRISPPQLQGLVDAKAAKGLVKFGRDLHHQDPAKGW
jgi:hypothetical protein